MQRSDGAYKQVGTAVHSTAPRLESPSSLFQDESRRQEARGPCCAPPPQARRPGGAEERVAGRPLDSGRGGAELPPQLGSYVLDGCRDDTGRNLSSRDSGIFGILGFPRHSAVGPSPSSSAATRRKVAWTGRLARQHARGSFRSGGQCGPRGLRVGATLSKR